MNQLKTAYNEQLNNYRKKPKGEIGVIGNLETGVVDDPDNRPNVFVTMLGSGVVISCPNYRCKSIYQQPVVVGEDPENLPGTRQVLGVWDVYQGEVAAAGTPYHRKQHQWPSPDSVYVAGELLLPSLAVPVKGELKVKIYPGPYRIDDAWLKIDTITTIDLSGSVPTETNQARMAMIVVNRLGNFVVRNGAIVYGWSNLSDANIPNPEIGDNCLWAVKCFKGQTEFLMDGNNNDFIDLRQTGAKGGSTTYNASVLEDISDQVDGIATHFTIITQSNSVIVFVHNLPQYSGFVTLDEDGMGFTLATAPQAGDTLEALCNPAATIIVSEPVPDWVLNHPDNVPAFPDAMDDEFDDGVLAAKWNANISSGSVCSITESNSHLIMGHTSLTSEGKRHCNVWQVLPEGTCRFRAKLNIESWFANYVGIGLGVRVSSTNRAFRIMNFWANTSYVYRMDTTGESVNSEAGIAADFSRTFYCEIEITGSNVIWRRSTSGVDGTFTQVYSMGISAIGTIDQVGICCHPYNEPAGPLLVSADWFRRMA